jgi:hypothetical protein
VATRRGSAGIGSLDARKGEILLSLDVRPRRQKLCGSSSPRDERSEIVEVRLAQDITALRSRLGDTGSVIWRARYCMSDDTIALLQHLMLDHSKHRICEGRYGRYLLRN